MKKVIAIAAIIVGLAWAAAAQEPLPTIDQNEKTQVVNGVAAAIEAKYVFPDLAKKMGDLIRLKLKDGSYTSITDPVAFAERLTADIHSVYRDGHMHVVYDPESAGARKTEDDAAKKEEEALRQRQMRMRNYGFESAQILSGNIGYLKFDSFMDTQESFKVAVGAMAFLANCDALIIDLRQNGGGSPQMIQLLTSYFFTGDPKHLNSFHYREGDRIEQFWTQPYVPGDKLAATDLYVLTSSRSFSGAEEFTYNLKNMKRATIVGETTGGGAHPVSFETVNDHFLVGVPYARAVNPISQTNWEGTGVEPDVKVAADKALETAEVMALEKLIAKEKTERFRKSYQWAADGLKADLSPVTVEAKTLTSYVGTYGPRTITFENGALYYQREGRPKMKMIPMAADMFRFDAAKEFRLKVVVKDGKVAGVEGHYIDGETDHNAKVN